MPYVYVAPGCRRQKEVPIRVMVISLEVSPVFFSRPAISANAWESASFLISARSRETFP